MGYTIATHNGSAVARDHNIRNEKVVSKESHIDPNGIHETWIDEKPRQAYERLFGQSVADYNKKQKRTDGKIKNYYADICKDAKKHPVYEMIVSIGNRDNAVDEQIGKQILREFVDSWNDRNSNLELIGAYYHADEEGVPHVHCDYIPVAHGYTRGMETQTGLVKALGEMGFEKQGKATAQILWEHRENDTLETLCKARGLIIEHPLEEKRTHLHTDAYKARQELTGVRQELERCTGQIKVAKELQAVGKTSLLHKDCIIINRSDYDSLYKTAMAVNDVRQKQAQLDQDLEQVRKSKKKLADADNLKDKMQQLVTKQEQLIEQRAAEIAKIYQENMHAALQQQLENMDSNKKNKYKRMQDYLKGFKLRDGTNALEHFEQTEKNFVRQIVEQADKMTYQSMNQWEREIDSMRKQSMSERLASAKRQADVENAMRQKNKPKQHHDFEL